MIRLLSALSVFALLWQPVVADDLWNVRGHIPFEQFVVQAHRGAGELAEENTPEAFQLGWSLNCIPEADVRTTQDGVIVAFHDKDFSRVVKNLPANLAKRGVDAMTFNELQKLDVGSFRGEQFAGRRVQRMSEIFKLMQGHPQRQLYLDWKQADLPQLAEEVRSSGVEKQVIFATTRYELIREWKRLLPTSQTLLWMGGTEEKLEKRFAELRDANFADLTQVQIHVSLTMPVEEITRQTLNPFRESDAFLRARGDELRLHGILFQSLPWDGSTQPVYQKLLDLGVMSFATDHPRVTWDAIRSYYSERT